MIIFTLQAKANLVLETVEKQWFRELTITDKIDSSLCTALSELWADNGVKECYRRRNEFHLEDCAKQYEKVGLLFEFV